VSLLCGALAGANAGCQTGAPPNGESNAGPLEAPVRLKQTGTPGPDSTPVSGDAPTGHVRHLTAGEAAQAAARLDAIAEGLDEFGALSSSAAVVLRRPENFFGFRLDLTPREILSQQERISATSTVGDFQSLQVRVAAALSLLKAANEATDLNEASKLQGKAEGILAGALVDEQGKAGAAGGEKSEDGTKSDGGVGTPPELPKPGKSTEPVDFGGQGLSSGAYAARNPATLDIPLRQLIQQTFDDHTVLRLFEWFSSPDHSAVGENKEVFAALLNVSCRPGRRTYSGYVGEVVVEVGYAKKEEQGLKSQHGRYPLSFAVFPAVDSQMIDERTSLRKQLALSILLEAMLKQVSVAGQLDYVKQLNRDIASLTARNAVVGFNMGGRFFGWRFSPRLVAQTDPGATNTGSGNILEPQTIPAVVLLIADREDLKGYTEGGQGGQFDHFIFRSTMRWMPAPAPSVDASWVPFARASHEVLHPRLPETDFITWALHADEVERLLDRAADAPTTQAAGATSGGQPSAVATVLRKRLAALHAAGLGSDHVASIPAARGAPIFSASVPTVEGWVDRETTLILPGQRLNGAVLAASVGGLPATITAIGDSAVKITIPPPGGRPDASRLAPVTVAHEGGSSLVANVKFSMESRPPDAARAASGRLIDSPVVIAPGTLAFEFVSAAEVPPFLDKVTLHLRPSGQPNAPWLQATTTTIARLTPTRVGVTLTTLPESVTGPQGVKGGLYDVDLRAAFSDGLPATTLLRETHRALLIPGEEKLRPKPKDATSIAFDKDGIPTGGFELVPDSGWALLFELQPALRAIGSGNGAISSLRLVGGGREIELPLSRLTSGGVVVAPRELTIARVFDGLPASALEVTMDAREIVHRPAGGGAEAEVRRPAAGTIKFTRPAPPEEDSSE